MDVKEMLSERSEAFVASANAAERSERLELTMLATIGATLCDIAAEICARQDETIALLRELVEQGKPKDRGPACMLECEADRVPCDRQGPWGYSCSRKMGHDGDHVACGRGHEYSVWPQGDS